MVNDIEETIGRLKDRYHVTSDSELARTLGVNKSTISSWKARNKIPARILEIIESDMVAVQSPPIQWGPFQQYAFGLALQRYTRVLADILGDLDLHQSVKLAGSSFVFFDLMGRAEGAILNLQDKGDYSYETAATMLIHEDMVDPKAALHRDIQVFRENGFL